MLLCPILLFCLCGCLPNPVAISSKGKIAVCLDKNGKYEFYPSKSDMESYEVYITDPEVSFLKRVTFDNAYNGGLAWSVDGSRLLFVTIEGFDKDKDDETPTSKLYVVDENGTKAEEILETTGMILTPAWSPDGKEIAFLRKDEKEGFGGALYIYDIDSQKERKLADWSMPHFAWSPDGNGLAALTGKKEIRLGNDDLLYANLTVFRKNATSSSVSGLFSWSGPFFAWSKDRIFFTSMDITLPSAALPEDDAIRIYSTDISNEAAPVPLADSPSILFAASPSGNRLLAVTAKGEDKEPWITVMDFDKQQQLKKVFEVKDGCWAGFWLSEDRFGYVGDGKIWLCNTDGTEKVDFTKKLRNTFLQKQEEWQQLPVDSKAHQTVTE